MATATKTYTFAPGTTVLASEANTNFNDLLSFMNNQVIHKDASVAFTNVPSGPATDPASADQFTRKAYVDNLIKKGTAAARVAYPTPTQGMFWVETDTDRLYTYTTAAWSYQGGGTDPTLARAYRATDENLTNTAWTNVTLDTETYDYGNNFAASHYTAPETASYRVDAQVVVKQANTIQRLILGVWLNDVEQWRGTDQTIRGVTSGDTTTLRFNDWISLTAGDRVSLHVYNGQASTCVTSGGTTQSYLSIRKG